MPSAISSQRSTSVMKNNRNTISIVIIIALLCTTVILSAALCFRSKEESVYTLYVGTTMQGADAESLSYEEAAERIGKVLIKYTSGYTLFDAKGAGKDENDNIVSESSVVCHIAKIDEETMRSIVKELLSEMDQKSIMVQRSRVQIEFIDAPLAH